MHYRKEIDGLRTVAVLPVIFFHAGLSAFSGGYIGVDVFFVISGYLITSLLIRDLEQGRFSLLQFYERRVRRILPALFLVILCCLPFAWLWMLPSQYQDFSRSLVGVVLFISNVLFWKETGYFEPAVEEKPLLHTWSLAVEEQFYILFPLLLWALWRLGSRKGTVWVLAGLTLISLLGAEFGSRVYPSASFYLLPTRAWELGCGVLCALILSRRQGLSPHDGLSGLGLALILIPVFVYDENLRFPSVYALAPVLGTALIILFCDPTTRVGRLLSLRWAVGIGLLSYSAYLWHQPLFAFARLRLGDLEPVMTGALILGTFGLAYLSWRFVERPFRDPRSRLFLRRVPLFVSMALIGAVILSAGIWGIERQGAPERFGANAAALAALNTSLKINYGLDEACEDPGQSFPTCSTDPTPRMLLWGDSFAMHLAQAFQHSDSALPFQQYTQSACAPILGQAVLKKKTGPVPAQGCLVFNDWVFDWLKQNPAIDYVVLSSAFTLLQDRILQTDGTIQPQSQSASLVTQGMLDTIRQIQALGKKVVLISPPPSNGKDIGRCLARVALLGWSKDRCDFIIADSPLDIQHRRSVIEAIAQQVPVLWLDQLLCPEGRCGMQDNGFPVLRDKEGHLSRDASAFIGRTYDLMGQVITLAR